MNIVISGVSIYRENNYYGLFFTLAFFRISTTLSEQPSLQGKVEKILHLAALFTFAMCCIFYQPVSPLVAA
jgi:hypothetical protein